MRPTPTGVWRLGAHTEHAADAETRFEITDVRLLTNDEVAQFQADADFLNRISAAETILELAKAYEAVRGDHYMIVESAGREPEDRSQLRRDIDRFLAALVAFRHRMEKIGDEFFSAEEAAELRAAFDRAYKVEKHYRLAWELRNETLHGGSPTQGLSIHQSSDGTTWSYKIADLLDGRADSRAWKQVGALWQGIEAVPLLNLFSMAYSYSEVTFGMALTRNATVVRSALARVTALANEVGPREPGKTPAVFRTLWEREGDETSPLEMKMHWIGDRIEQETEHALESARNVVARWNSLRSGGDPSPIA